MKARSRRQYRLRAWKTRSQRKEGQAWRADVVLWCAKHKELGANIIWSAFTAPNEFARGEEG